MKWDRMRGLREGLKQATEVAQKARQHYCKGLYQRNLNKAPCYNGGTPK